MIRSHETFWATLRNAAAMNDVDPQQLGDCLRYALRRGEPVSAAWLLVAGVASYFIASRFYARFLATTVLGLEPFGP